jgi:hypothetical protein
MQSYAGYRVRGPIHRFQHGLAILCDHREIRTSRRVRFPSSLLPFLKGPGIDTKGRAKIGL